MASRSVGLLELAARDDVFLGDGGLAALEPRLRAAGHAVTRARRVLARAAGPEAWQDELAAWVRAGAFDLLVLSRAWDGATLAALRAALPAGGRLVRLAAGTGAPLDDRFDHVVAPDGVLALAAGDDAAPAAFRPATARALRARRAPPPAEAGDAAGARPTLSGPASGCPFLLDVRANPRFAGVRLDPDRDRTRGCAFCLDNAGGYAAASEEETVAAWTAQLRAIRAARPDAREVLLTDERPHPHLAAFFRRLEAEPGLAPVELLVKSRVDWLLEAEGALDAACDAAARTGSVLHVYLVGFESFDQATLDLFNKGVAVEDNRRAIALLRALAARHPGSFEFARHRAHGFVAFTPWTTPEGLLESARVMREVGFGELRAEAVRTRLRLHAGTPLHALAAAEGLLAAEHAGGHGDRAAEQGYDASVPWRFADPRVEAIARVALALHEARRELEDADVLELSTRWILRWPALAAHAAVAHLPLLAAVASWGSLEAAALLGGAAVVDREVDLLAAGPKRAALKEGVAREDAPGLVAAYRAMGLAAAVLEAHDLDAAGNAHRPGDRLAIVAVARDEAALAQALDGQRRRDVLAMGALMGYPSCCVEAFAAQPDRGDNAENERLTLRRAPGAPLAPALGRVGRLRLVSHHPCAPSCAPSVALAARALARVADADPGAAARVRAELARPLLFLDHRRALALDGAFEGDAFAVRGVEPLAWPGDRDALAGLERIELDLAGATLRRHGRPPLRVDAPRPLLAVPGARLHPRALAALGGALPPAVRWLLLAPEPRRNDRPLGAPPAPGGAPPALAALEAALEAGRAQGATSLELGGGEPTLRRDLPALVRRARRLGFARVRLCTNGMLLAYPEVARRLAGAGLTEVALALRGAGPATHDRLVRTPGAFDLLLRGGAAARAAGLPLEGDLVVTASGAGELPAMIRALAALGAVRFRARLLAPAPGDADAKAEAPRLADAVPHLVAALEDGADLACLDVPPCALPPEHRAAASSAASRAALVAAPGGELRRLEDIEAGRAVPAGACGACAFRGGCGGLPPEYLARFGADELRPVAVA